jgi:hypothetical protein
VISDKLFRFSFIIESIPWTLFQDEHHYRSRYQFRQFIYFLFPAILNLSDFIIKIGKIMKNCLTESENQVFSDCFFADFLLFPFTGAVFISHSFYREGGLWFSQPHLIIKVLSEIWKKHHGNFFQAVFSSCRIRSVIPFIFFRSESLCLFTP